VNFFYKHSWEIYFALLFAVIASIIIEIFYKPYRKWLNKPKELFEVICNKSSSIMPENILGIRGMPDYGFYEYYHFRPDVDNKISRNINAICLYIKSSDQERKMTYTIDKV
jgi:hypothetical protein